MALLTRTKIKKTLNKALILGCFSFALISCGEISDNPTGPKECEHALEFHKGKDSTCTVKGTIPYYQCTKCKKVYKDVNASEEILQASDLKLDLLNHNYEHHDATDSNCSVPGNIEYFECTMCHGLFSDENGTKIEDVVVPINSSKHNYQAPTYLFSDDFSTCTATCCCSYDVEHKHDITETVNTTIDSVDGVNYYVATFSSYYFTKQRRLKNVDLELTKIDTNVFEFNINSYVNYYKVVDSNDYKSDGEKTYFTSQITTTKITYVADYVGDHNIQVFGYDGSNNIIATSNICTCEIEPVYYYQAFNEVYYLNRADAQTLGISQELINSASHHSGDVGSADEVLKFYIDDNCNWTINENYKISSFSLDYFKLIKSSGANVVMFESQGGMIKVDDTKYATSLIKKYLDELYSLGMKAIISNEREIVVFNNLDSINSEGEFMSRFSSALNADLSTETFLSACAHPATYGLFIGDEPFMEKLPKVGYLVSWLKQFFASKSLQFPHLFCDLVYYASFLFDNEQAYIDYIAKWVEVTGEDYLAFDMYTHTANGVYNKDASIMNTYNAINKYRKINPNIKIHQTINANNARAGSLTYKDVFGSLYLALSQGYYGLSWFSFNPIFPGDWINGMVKPSMSSGMVKNAQFDLITEANRQFFEIKKQLIGYSFSDCTITDKKETTSSKYKKYLSSNLTNGTSQINIYVNYGTSDGVTNTVNVGANKQYWVCKNTGISKLQAGSSTVKLTLNNGEAVIIFN